MTDPSAHRYVKQVCLRTHVRPLLFFWRKLRTHVRPLLFSGGSCGYLRAHASRHQRTHKRTQADTHASTCLCWDKHAVTHAPTWFWDRKCADTYVSTRFLAPHHVCGHTAARTPALNKKEHLQGLGFPGFSGLRSKRVSPLS